MELDHVQNYIYKLDESKSLISDVRLPSTDHAASTITAILADTRSSISQERYNATFTWLEGKPSLTIASRC